MLIVPINHLAPIIGRYTIQNGQTVTQYLTKWNP